MTYDIVDKVYHFGTVTLRIMNTYRTPHHTLEHTTYTFSYVRNNKMIGCAGMVNVGSPGRQYVLDSIKQQIRDYPEKK